MAKKIKKNKFGSKWIKIPLLILLILVSLISINSLLPEKSSRVVIRKASLFDSSPKKIVFQSCGSRLPEYKYSLELPANWTISRTSYDEASTYFEAASDEKSFTVSCTNQGVGGGCDEKYHTKFTVNGKEYNTCFGIFEDRWSFGVLNLSTDSKTNATVSFWAEGLERLEIEKVLSSFKLIGNQ